MKRIVSSESVVVAGAGQVSSEIGGDVAILDLKAGTYYGLDSVGARIWQLVQEPAQVEMIRDTLVEEYDVGPDRCEQDLLALLQDLVDEGLLEVRYQTRT